MGSTWAAVKAFAGTIFPRAMEFINRLMGAVPGNISDCVMDSRLVPSSWILTIPTAFSLASLVIRTDLMPNAAFFARLMAARHGRKFYTKMKTPELSISSLIWLTRKLFMWTCGLRAALHGPQGILIAALEAACTNPPMAAARGNN